MTDSYFGPERRAPATEAEAAPEVHWSVDRKIPLALVVGMVLQVMGVIWYVADMKKDIELLKADSIVLHQRDSAQADSFREAVRTMQDQLIRFEAKLDRLIEKDHSR